MLQKITTFFIVIFFIFSFCSLYSAHAIVILPSLDITTDTTWTAAGSPYAYNQDINILNGAKLTIEAGTEVDLGGWQMNIINGELIVSGTEGSEPAIRNGVIIVHPNGKLSLSRAIIENGGYYESNFYCDNYDTFENCYTEEYYDGAIIAQGGEINIDNSIIANNEIGLEAEAENNIINIHNSQIYNNNHYGIINDGDTAINATDNWWGDDTGPYHPTLNPFGMGDKIKGNILFNPWLTQTKKKNPLIIMPGIMGSYLNKNESGLPEVWLNIDEMIKPGEDAYLYDLAMNSAGYPEKNLLPTDIMRKVLASDFFYGLIEELKDNGYKENEDLFVFPYDWRYFIEWSANEGDPFPLVKSLKERIEEVKNQTNSEKVNIIAHSMGGLVAKYYMWQNGTDSIDKFIDIGTPHLGSPNSFKAIMYGDNLGVKISWYYPINSVTIRSISQNIPSLYELLPSREYFDETDNDYAYYIYDMHDLDSNGVKGRLNYDESLEFMKNTGRNNYLLGFNDSLHNALDNYSPPSEGVSTYNIISCGQPTLGQIFVLNKEKSGKYEYGLKYINGDGTVPLKSAEAITANKTYYANGVEHAYLPSSDGIKELIIALLKGEESTFDFSKYNNIREDKNNCALNGTQISFHSPIQMHVYDENNNHLGPHDNGDIEISIEGAAYDDIDGNKFAFLPKGHNYRITGQAESAGSFNLRIQNVNNGEYNQTIYFNEIPLASSSANVQLEINDNGQNNYFLNIDQEGDQIFESEISPSSILNEEETEDLVPPTTEINITGTPGNDDWYISDVQITLTSQDNENGSGILKTEYSLDNGATWNIYSEPIAIIKKGEHAIIYKSTDRAGNVEEAKEYKFKIIATIDSTINDIRRSYDEKNITKKLVRDSLIAQLEWIKKFNEKFNKTEIGKKIIIKQYEMISKQLDLYYRLKWINEKGYNIIKEDIEYLKNN